MAIIKYIFFCFIFTKHLGQKCKQSRLWTVKLWNKFFVTNGSSNDSEIGGIDSFLTQAKGSKVMPLQAFSSARMPYLRDTSEPSLL